MTMMALAISQPSALFHSAPAIRLWTTLMCPPPGRTSRRTAAAGCSIALPYSRSIWRAGLRKGSSSAGKEADTDSNLMIAAPNCAEVRYTVERKVGLSEWLRVRARLLGLPFNIVPADQELSELAGELKVKKMSLADCFAAALPKREKAEIYTGDPEFKTAEREIKIVWL
jgi:predicted nucleic acid-binding protein